MKKLRLGVLGVSNHFIKRIVLPAKQLTNIQLTSIASRSELKASKYAKAFDIPHYYGDYQQLLDSTDIDAVYIPLPNHLHGEWIRKAADAGKHILCEKPLSMNAHEAKAVVEYCQKKGVYLMEAFMYKYHPQWQKVRDIIRTNNIGKISFIHTSFSYNNPSPTNIRNIKAYGGGGLRDIGCYAISSARYLIEKEPIQVISQRVEHPDFKTDALSTAILDFGNCKATFTVSTNSNAFQKVDVIGTVGYITIHLPFNSYTDVPAKLTVVTAIGHREITIAPTDQYGLMLTGFANAILEQKPFSDIEDDAILNQKVIDAVINSAHTGRWETID